MITAVSAPRPVPPMERIGILGGMRPQGVGNYLHRANASEFSGETPFRSAEGMGGGIYQEPFFMQPLDSFVGQFVFSWFFEPICVWNTDNGYPFQRGETLGSISGSGG